VWIDGQLVGYLPRQLAAGYVSGLAQLMASSGAHVALRGVIVGGGYRGDGPGKLGVWLSHDPAAFGIASSRVAGVRRRRGLHADRVQRGAALRRP
jgi:hypothetical protein